MEMIELSSHPVSDINSVTVPFDQNWTSGSGEGLPATFLWNKDGSMSTSRGVADAVVRMPRDFESGGDVSFHALLRESGYNRQHAAVDVSMIEIALRADPEFVRDWLWYSENKRSSPGWFLRVAESGGWEVGYVDRGECENVSFDQDDVVACAIFIKKEIDAVRASVRGRDAR